MKVGLSTLFCFEQLFTTMLRYIETADVESIELIDDGQHAFNESRIKTLKEIVKKRGFATSVHAPFMNVNIASSSKSVRTSIMSRLKKSIQYSGDLGSRYWVFHPGLQTDVGQFSSELDWKTNLESIRELFDFAEQFGVTATIENGLHPLPFLLKTADDFLRFYKDFGETTLGLTLDIGHANVNNQINWFFEKLPEKIVHAHLHDNHGKSDEHLGLGDGNVDWQKTVRAFKRISFKGTLVIESAKNVEESIQRLKELIARP
ncbi:sugar phosphate isomerase/epimerase [Candidatus Bathyarchaeota archaeon]|nr:sugar phosphate isomerase/epimerase [Candidatus Bathyarchaeota archaeon]